MCALLLRLCGFVVVECFVCVRALWIVGLLCGVGFRRVLQSVGLVLRWLVVRWPCGLVAC